MSKNFRKEMQAAMCSKTAPIMNLMSLTLALKALGQRAVLVRMKM